MSKICLPYCLLLMLLGHASAAETGAQTIEQSASLGALFPAEQVNVLADILPADQQVHWRVHVPERTEPNGVLVFVSPDASGEPQAGWVEILDKHGLIWVCADDFGNRVPSNQRVLAALMGLTLIQKNYPVDKTRTYIAGMSGGGRIASMTITKFPQLFTGALYIVGANFWTPADQPLLQSIAANRYVFLTGDADFNRKEMRAVYRRYHDAGVQQILLLDLPRFGHQYPTPEQFEHAVAFLDTGVKP